MSEAGEKSAIGRTVTERHHPLRVRRGVVGPLQRFAHVLGHRSGHEQHIGMARRGDKAQAEAFEIVEGVVEGVNFKLTAVARAGIHFTDCQAVAESPLCRVLDMRRQFGKRRLVRSRRLLGQRRVR